MLEIFKYGKKVDIHCFVCDKAANFDIHIASKNGKFMNVNVCENCLNQLKKEFSAFESVPQLKAIAPCVEQEACLLNARNKNLQ